MDIRRILPFLPAAFWMGLIWVLSAQDASASSTLSGDLAAALWRILPFSLEGTEAILRQGAHFTLYLVLGGLLAWGSRGRRLWASFAAGGLYALSDEVHQAFVPGRAMEGADILTDLLGLGVGILLLGYLLRKRNEKAGS